MKTKSKHSLALILIGALLAGLLPVGTETKSQAAEQPKLKNPRMLKTVEEVAPEERSKKMPENLTTENGITTWDCIWFGNYWQEDTNGDGKADKNDKKTPIKWRVLSVDGDDVFLVADKNLDCQRYNDTRMDVTWETCTMRSWLNGYGEESNKDGKDYSGNNFLDNAFSAKEQSAVKTTNVVNNDNPEYGTEGGNDTTDKVYLLSLDEVTNPAYGFASHNSISATREAVNTAYTAEGGEIESEDMNGAGNAEDWRLRSSGYSSRYASRVGSDGCVRANGSSLGFDNAVRPVLHLNLSSSVWSYAGSMTSQGEESETATPTPDVTSTPTPDGTTTSTPDVTATPTPDVTTSPTSTEPSNDTTQTAKPTDESNKQNSLSKGTVLKDKKNEVSYRVLAQDRVEFYKADNKATSKITIPSAVSMDGVKFKVTDISDNAFNGCKKLKSVTIGKSVTTIGNKAFSKCTSLKKITIPAGVTKIGKKAFYGCKKLKSITIKTKKLKNKSVGAQAFKGLHKKAVIKVPKKQKKAYTKWLRKKGITKKMKIK